MGKPEDIEGRPLTEKDVRRIAKEEIEKSANLARELRFMANYNARTEEIRRALAGESPLNGEYDGIAQANDFYTVRRAVPPPGDNQPKDSATPAYLAFMRIWHELHRLRTIEEARKASTVAHSGERIGKSYLRHFLENAPVEQLQRAFDDLDICLARRQVIAETALGDNAPGVRPKLETTVQKAFATIRDHLGYLEEGGAECEKALDVIEAAFRP